MNKINDGGQAFPIGGGDMVIDQLKAENETLRQHRDELLEALDQMVSVAERVDGWESFPSAPIEVALNAIAKTKGA